MLSADEIFRKMMNEIAPLPCQESYARQLSALISYHYRKNMLMDAGISADSIPYQGAVVVAPTGQGKTYLLKAASKVLDINVICLDASTIAHEGWKGPSLSQQLLGSKRALNNDEKWERSILFLDEFDKLKLYGTEHDQGNAMENILQLYNQGTIAAEGEGKLVEMLDISRFTIVLGGAFEGIDEIIKNRISPSKSVGFFNSESEIKLSKAGLIKQVTLKDLQEYGFMPELLGRISSIISIDPMTTEDYRCLLSAKKGSISYKYKTYFTFAYGIGFDIDESAIKYISSACLESISGARAVNPLINDIMREAFIMVDRDNAINKIILRAKDDKCFLDYEYGERNHSPFMDNCDVDDDINKKYYMSEKSTTAIAYKLINIYKKIQTDVSILEELKTFLNVTLLYLKEYCNEDEFSFISLEKIARTVYKSDRSEKSTFDILITDVLKRPIKNKNIERYYEHFNKCWNRHTSHHIVKALGYIHKAIKQEHNSAIVNFKVESET